jgi:hypothetical protein
MLIFIPNYAKKKDKNKKWPIRERIKNQQPIETPQWPMYYPHMQYGGITTNSLD